MSVECPAAIYTYLGERVALDILARCSGHYYRVRLSPEWFFLFMVVKKLMVTVISIQYYVSQLEAH